MTVGGRQGNMHYFLRLIVFTLRLLRLLHVFSCIFSQYTTNVQGKASGLKLVFS